MAELGIDGDQWYVGNGLDLGDPRAHYTFADTPREAIDEHDRKFPSYAAWRIAEKHKEYLDMTPDEYHQWKEDNGQFGVGA